MHANSPQTKEQVLATKDRSRFRLTLALIILGALAFSIVAGWLGLVKPVAAADLSNGAFCITAKSDNDPEIKGMAGNCKPEAPTAPVEVPDIAISKEYSTITPVETEPGLADVRLFVNAQPDRYLSFWVDGSYIGNSPTASGRGAMPITVRANYLEGIYPAVEVCYAPNPSAQSRKDCVDLDVASLFA